MKTCFKCGIQKPLNEFYKHSRMADGYLNKCKDCNRLDSSRHRSENLEKVRAYDNKRSSLPHRKKLRTLNTKIVRQKYPEYAAAHRAVSRKLKKQPCERCGKIEMVHAHHDDYSRPLDVMWLCPLHHRVRHKEIGKILASSK